MLEQRVASPRPARMYDITAMANTLEGLMYGISHPGAVFLHGDHVDEVMNDKGIIHANRFDYSAMAGSSIGALTAFTTAYNVACLHGVSHPTAALAGVGAMVTYGMFRRRG